MLQQTVSSSPLGFETQIEKLSHIYKSKAPKHKQYKAQRNFNEMKNSHRINNNNNNNNHPHQHALIEVIDSIINSTSKDELKRSLTKQMYKYKNEIKLRNTLHQLKTSITNINNEISKNNRTINVIDKHISKERSYKDQINQDLSTKLKELHNIEHDIVTTNNQCVVFQNLINNV